MINQIESQKVKAKEIMEKTLDEYFEAFERGSNQDGFTIHKIEQLMLRNAKKMKQAIEEVSGELASSVEIDIKKNVLNVNRHWNEPREIKQ